MSASAENEYFSDGITEEIINALAKIDGLKVTSRTSAFHFKGKNIPMPEIGKSLGVSTLLEGSVRLAGNTMRITAQLIDAAEDFHFWSETWDRKLDNIFEVQDEISLLIGDKLREHFGHFEIQEHLVAKQTDSIDAYELFLKAMFHKNKWNPDDIRKAISFYEQALEVDPKHAQSLAGLADSYSFLATTAVIPYEEGWGKCAQLTHQALGIDNELPAAYYQLANLAFFTAFDYREAFRMASKAISLNPNHAESQQFMSFLYILSGKKERAEIHLQTALDIDPMSQETQFYGGYFHYMFEDYPEALEQLNLCLEVNPLNIPCHYVKTLCLIKMERYDEVIQYFDELPSQIIVPGEKTGSLTIAHTLNGDESEAADYLNLLQEQAKGENGFTADSYLFSLYGATDQKDKAFDWVKQGLQNGSPLLMIRFADPIVNPIKNDPRYEQFHRQIFPEDLLPSKPQEKRKKPLLDERAAAAAKTQLVELMSEDKSYLNPDISLRLLAEELSIHPNQLSWLLNDGFGKNFNEFINHYRIEAFKNLAKEPENANLTIMAIAYDCGFNSKTVFNTYFKKETGTTPKRFLQG